MMDTNTVDTNTVDTNTVDFKKTLASYRAPRGRFEIVDVPDLRYLMVDGRGDPNTSPAYADALSALYPVSYALKFASKRVLGRDYVVPPLEGLWWADDMDTYTVARDKSRWSWTMMLMIPEWVGDRMVDDAVAQVAAKSARLKSARATTLPARLDDVRVGSLSEGLCVQTLHVGSFDDEAPVLERMHHEFMPEHGLRFNGKHHEVYFSDARRVPPHTLRTLLRQPVTPA